MLWVYGHYKLLFNMDFKQIQIVTLKGIRYIVGHSYSFHEVTFATCSSHLPRDMKTSSIGGVSKKVFGLPLALSIIAKTTTRTEYVYATEVAMAIRTSMLVVWCLIAVQAWM